MAFRVSVVSNSRAVCDFGIRRLPFGAQLAATEQAAAANTSVDRRRCGRGRRTPRSTHRLPVLDGDQREPRARGNAGVAPVGFATKARHAPSGRPFAGMSPYCGSMFADAPRRTVSSRTQYGNIRIEMLTRLDAVRPDAIHLCAPALVASDIVPLIRPGTGGLGRSKTVVYYSHKDVTLGILLRAILKGDQAVGETGLPDVPVDSSVRLIDASNSLGGYYVRAHTDYAHKFHYFAHAPTALRTIAI